MNAATDWTPKDDNQFRQMQMTKSKNVLFSVFFKAMELIGRLRGRSGVVWGVRVRVDLPFKSRSLLVSI